MEFALQDLKQYLYKASQATYATGNESLITKESDKSSSIKHTEGNWSFHDNYFGGEPYGGREVVFFKGEPVYIMIYYGWVTDSSKDPSTIYKFLQLALRNATAELPYRGPTFFNDGDFEYINMVKGEINRFDGHESIKYKGDVVFETFYRGGLVDVKL